MDDLATFLRARYDEWERRAQYARPHETGSRDEGQPPDWVSWRRGPGNAEFGLRHVATLRVILIEHLNVGGSCRMCIEWPPKPWPCRTVRLLGADFSHLPDYRQEWAPEP